MKTTLIFVRHAQSVAPVQGIVQGRGLTIPLSPAGEMQAATAGQRLRDVAFDRMFSSTALRAIKTAESIHSQDTSVPWERIEALNERSKGEGEGLKKEDFNIKYPEVIEQWGRGVDARPPGGESFQDVEDRVMPVIRQHVCKYKGEKLLYVIHGNVIRVILGNLMNIPVQQRHQIEQTYCAYNEAVYLHEHDRWTIVNVNCDRLTRTYS